MLLENIYSTGVTHDDRNMFIVEATGYSLDIQKLNYFVEVCHTKIRRTVTLAVFVLGLLDSITHLRLVSFVSHQQRNLHQILLLPHVVVGIFTTKLLFSKLTS